MNFFTRTFKPGAAVLLFICCLTASAQWNKKPYTEWTEKESLKVLNDSPWGQTQTFSDTSQMTGNQRLDSGASRIAEDFEVNFRIRFMSARPVREASARTIELQQKGELNQQLAAQLKSFATAEAPFPDYIVITVTCDAKKVNNHLQQANELLYKLTTSDLKNNTYLLVKGGERIFLKEYQQPRKDGFGARFIFPRFVGGKPLITAEGGEILFHAELGGGPPAGSAESLRRTPTGPTRTSGLTPFDGFTLNMRYKTKDMMYAGKLEY
jgi:hypothetical protein